MNRRLTIFATMLALLATTAASRTDAQIDSSSGPSTTTRVRSRCFRGARADQCRNYAVFEVTGAMTSSFWRRELGACSQPGTCSSSGLENGYWAWELGAMHNVDNRFAAGGHLHIGAGSRSVLRVAPEARGRLWLGHSFALDAAAGPLLIRRASTGSMMSGLTAEVVLDAADVVGISVGVERFGGPGGSDVYIGARTGSYASLVGSVVAGLALMSQTSVRNWWR